MNKADRLSPTLNRFRTIALIVGIVGTLAAIAGIFVSGPGQFFQSYLFSFVFWIGVSLGSLAIIMVYYVTGGRWAFTVRGIADAGSRTLWLMAILFVPIVIGLPFLYPWARPAAVAQDALLQYKSIYLNVPFFIIRAVIYFAIWILLSAIITRLAARPEVPADRGLFQQLRRWSVVGIILYFLTMSFASIDWIMSLEPEWVSTVFGLVTIMAQGLVGETFAIIVLGRILPGMRGQPSPAVQRDPYNPNLIQPQINRDLGAVMLAFVMGWAYMAFFQYLIIWGGNVPREVFWFIERTSGGWQILALIVIVFQFALPFLLLISMQTRTNLRILSGITALTFVISLVYIFWQVMPAFYPKGFHLDWLDIVVPIAMGGLWLFAFATRLRTQTVMELIDRSLPEERLQEAHG